MTGFFSKWVKSRARVVVGIEDIRAAAERVRAVLPITPLTYSPRVSELVGHDVYFKWDNKQRTGSFKERGAVNFLGLLDSAERTRGVCAASAGNHAMALSFHAARIGVPCHIVMPTTAPLVKIQSTRNNGAEVILHGLSFDDSYTFAKELAKEKRYTFAPAFDHPAIIAGQGTAGLEILDQLPDVDSIIASVGGGGLISGLAIAVKSRGEGPFVLGVQSSWAVQARAKKGQPVDPARTMMIPPGTIADGIAVKYPGEHTQPIIESHVDKLVTVEETEIANALVRLMEYERVVVEGASAAAFAGLLARALPTSCRRTVVMMSGSNIDMNMVSRLIERDMAQQSRMMRLIVSVPDRPGTLHATTGILAKIGANVLQVFHDRTSSTVPGNVDISFVLEVRDAEHQRAVVNALTNQGLEARVEG